MKVGDERYQQAIELAVAELRERARGAARPEEGLITYQDFSELLGASGFKIPYFSKLMSQLLADISLHEDAQGRGMISALVVQTDAGEPGTPSDGFYALARSAPFDREGSDEQVWREELQRTHREHRDGLRTPAGRTVTRENLGAWLLKCNPETWDIESFVSTGAALDNWSVQPSYRTDLMEDGQRVFLWVTGRENAPAQPGLWAAGIVTGPVYEESVDADEPFWLDDDQRDRSAHFVPIEMRMLPKPIARSVLQADQQLAGMEIFRQPQMSNPLWISREELAALEEHVAPPAISITLSEYGAGLGNAESRRAVELAAMDAVRSHYEGAGWQVADVSRENRGWDLTCTAPDEEKHQVEVKGVSGVVPNILLTRNEGRAARECENWRLAVVTQALTNSPRIRIVDGPTAMAVSETFTYSVNLTQI